MYTVVTLHGGQSWCFLFPAFCWSLSRTTRTSAWPDIAGPSIAHSLTRQTIGLHHLRLCQVNHLSPVASEQQLFQLCLLAQKLASSHPGSRASIFTSTVPGTSHRRRRSSRVLHVPTDNVERTYVNPSLQGTETVTSIPFIEDEDYIQEYHMSLDRSPSPHRGGGWSSPGLTTPVDDRNGVPRSRGPSPSQAYGNANGGHGVTWATAKQRSERVNGYPSYQSQNQGFFARHMRKLSEQLPSFAHGGQEDRYTEKEKLGRGRTGNQLSRSWEWLHKTFGINLSRRRKYTALLVVLVLGLWILFHKPITLAYRRTAWLGGGSKVVMILGANQGGGVMDYKGAREWAIERDSVKNKEKYAARWGYELEIVDMRTKKRYAHEWRESWEKVDMIRNAMKKYPNAEWFWWLDLHTFIMEPSYSLQNHLFRDLGARTYRDININNPLRIQHPPNGTSGDPNAPKYANYLDPNTLSAVGDGDPKSINLIVPQDCGGFNLGSFFVRRSSWTDRLLDIWWDPVFYEQRHMEWEHKEQDALEYIYSNQPWVRPHTAFVPQRLVNAFPHGACGDDKGLPAGGCSSLKSGDDEQECGVHGIHYQEKARDFLVNMAGCEWGRDCWAEIYNFRQLSNKLNRTPWEKFKDWARDSWNRKKEEKTKKEG
nr:putative alpha-1,6-mannosyltransferase mnn10 [Quercus suber]